MERYVTLPEAVRFRSKRIFRVVGTLWTEYYRRLESAEYPFDRAIWITNYFPASFGVKPGSPEDRDTDEPFFCLSARVEGLDEIRDDLRKRGLPEREYRQLIGPYFQAFKEWVDDAVRKVWRQRSVQRLHERVHLAFGHFGIYSTPIDDLGTHEVEQMDWLDGDQLEGTKGARKRPHAKKARRKGRRNRKN